jgi:protein-disulfide isomerase
MSIEYNRKFQLAIGLLLALTPGAGIAQQTPGPKLNPREVEQIVRKYILDNPEVLLESVRLYQEREKTAQRQRLRDAVAAHQGELYDDPGSPVLGVADQTTDPVTVVAFFDYRCGYCKKVDDNIAKLASAPGVRVVYKEFPILGPDSVLAAKAALAAAKQGAYHKFHQALMASPSITPDSIERISADLKLDLVRLKKDMQSPEVDTAITKNHELAGALQVQSTPTFVIGKEIISGALTDDAFRAAIEAARNESKIAQVHSAGSGQKHSARLSGGSKPQEK